MHQPIMLVFVTQDSLRQPIISAKDSCNARESIWQFAYHLSSCKGPSWTSGIPHRRLILQILQVCICAPSGLTMWSLAWTAYSAERHMFWSILSGWPALLRLYSKLKHDYSAKMSLKLLHILNRNFRYCMIYITWSWLGISIESRWGSKTLRHLDQLCTIPAVTRDGPTGAGPLGRYGGDRERQCRTVYSAT